MSGSRTGRVDGKVVVVTGANTGIGKETAKALALRGAVTVLACRDPAKAEAAVADIRASTGNDAVSAVQVDLADLQQVERCAAALGDRYEKIDVLINNAGGTWSARQLTPQGLEHTFTVNYLSHYLLTRRLLPRLVAAAPGRVINVTSVAHRFARGVRWADPQYERGWRGLRAYNQSKLAQVLFTRELARRFAADGVIAHAAHPGLVRSHFAQDGDTRGLDAIAVELVLVRSVTPAQGAETSVYLATSPEAAETNGGYWVRCTPHRPSRAARSDHAARRLWELSEDLLTTAGVVV
jgi:NAD(P)-dependent dehydrogenase (short-subunit alcohol dehydrogenase family)